MTAESDASRYFRWFYDQGVWKRMHYRGVRILKVPSDLWNYQEIFAEHRVEWVLETGTRHGGSALMVDQVRDTCVNGHPVRPEFGPGPYEALEEFLARHPAEFLHDRAREAKFGFTAAPNGYLIKT